jgi:putative tryptophan/tyrosine transport system substrate-binding protein
MRRRDVLVLLGGAALAPVQARAQSRAPLVGALILTNPEPYWGFLREGLQGAGYADGRNIRLDFRSAEGNAKTLAAHSAELVRAQADVIIAVQTAPVRAAMEATKDIPIVMITGAPVEIGLIQSLSRPGGNVTGVSTSVGELAAKTLENMSAVLPGLRRVAVLVNAADHEFGKSMLGHVEVAAGPLKIDVLAFTIGRAEELEAAFSSMTKDGVQAVVVQPSLPRARVLGLARESRLPVIASNLGWAEAGALLCYSPDLRDVCRKAAGYVDRLLKGGKAAEMPVEQPTAFELAINLRTARALGIEVPAMVLGFATQVFE